MTYREAVSIVAGLAGLDSLVKYLCFAFIHEGESYIPITGRLALLHRTHRSEPHVTSEGETRPVLEVLKVLVELVLPYNTQCPIQINEFALESSIRVPHKPEATLQPGIRPFVRVGISIVDPRE